MTKVHLLGADRSYDRNVQTVSVNQIVMLEGYAGGRSHGNHKIPYHAEDQSRDKEQPVQTAVAQRLHRKEKYLINEIVMRYMSHFVADNPFEFLIRGCTEYAARQTDCIETESHGIRACIPVTVNLQLPFHPHFQEQTFQPCPFIGIQPTIASSRT